MYTFAASRAPEHGLQMGTPSMPDRCLCPISCRDRLSRLCYMTVGSLGLRLGCLKDFADGRNDACSLETRVRPRIRRCLGTSGATHPTGTSDCTSEDRSAGGRTEWPDADSMCGDRAGTRTNRARGARGGVAIISARASCESRTYLHARRRRDVRIVLLCPCSRWSPVGTSYAVTEP